MKVILTLLAVPTLALTAVAQDNPFAPAAEMGKFAPMIGHWEGTGTAIPVPGMEPIPWTASSHVELVAGGHAVRERTKVVLPGMPALEFIALYAWEGETQRYTSMSVQNQGPGSSNEVFWIDANTLLANRATTEQGAPLIERGITRYAGDKYTFKIERAVAAGPFYAYVEGKFNRTKLEPGSKTIEAAMPGTTPLANAGMKATAKMLGTWTVAGKMVPAPGIPEIPFSGTEKIESILGGTTLEARITGDKDESGFAYDGLWYLSWSEDAMAYDMFFVSNMGEVSHTQGRLVGNDLVVAANLYMQGTPVANRMVVHMGEDGLESAIGHALIGTVEPAKVFDAKYTRAK